MLLNAAAAIIAGGMAEDFPEGLEIAAQSIDTGRAKGYPEEARRVQLAVFVAVVCCKQNNNVATVGRIIPKFWYTANG